MKVRLPPPWLSEHTEEVEWLPQRRILQTLTCAGNGRTRIQLGANSRPSGEGDNLGEDVTWR